MLCCDIVTCPSSLKFKFLQFSLAVPRRVQDSLNISNNWVSRKEDAIFLCFVRERFASASEIWFISHVSWDKSWTPIIQCSTDPCQIREVLLARVTHIAESIESAKERINTCRNFATSLTTLRKTNSSLSLSNQPNFEILANKVTRAWMTKPGSLGRVAR